MCHCHCHCDNVEAGDGQRQYRGRSLLLRRGQLIALGHDEAFSELTSVA